MMVITMGNDRKFLKKKINEERNNYGNKGPWWYFTLHGLGPGMIPKDVHVVDSVEGVNKKGTRGLFIALDGVLTWDELKKYDLIELAPPKAMRECKQLKEANGDVNKWYVVGYFDTNRRGVDDNLMTDDIDEAKDFAWEMANRAYTVVKNEETGKEVVIDPDEVIDDVSEYINDKFRETEDFDESLDEDGKETIYTNLDTDNMVDEIRTHLKGVDNKKYIRDFINTQKAYGLITNAECDALYNEYGLAESLSLSKRLTEAKEDDFYFRAFITNLGKYNEGFLEGEWVDFPIEKTEFDEILKRHEIGEGEYEEWFVTDYESNLPGFNWQELGEYAGYDKLQEFGEKIDEINKSGQSKAIANAYEVTGDIQEAIDGIENGDIIFYDGISTDYDLGDVIITDVYNGEIPDELAERYFDYEGLGRDIRLEYYQEDDDMPETAGEYWCGDENASDYDIGEAFVNEVGIGDQDFHFDYEAFGRDLGFENFTFTKDGVIEMV